jgi:hypothetical protein
MLTMLDTFAILALKKYIKNMYVEAVYKRN